MPRYVALLRGINLGGHNRIAMAALRGAFESHGFGTVATYLQSGNIAFETDAANNLDASLQKLIEAEFGLNVPVVTRSQAELTRLVASQPFASDQSAWHVTFLSTVPNKAKVSELPASVGKDSWKLIGRDVYLEIPSGRYSETKLQNDWFESRLGVGATTRNWKTVLALEGL